MGENKNRSDKQIATAKHLVDSCSPEKRCLIEKLLDEHRREESKSEPYSLDQLLAKLRSYCDNDPKFEYAIEQFAAAESQRDDPLEEVCRR